MLFGKVEVGTEPYSLLVRVGRKPLHIINRQLRTIRKYIDNYDIHVYVLATIFTVNDQWINFKILTSHHYISLNEATLKNDGGTSLFSKRVSQI